MTYSVTYLSTFTGSLVGMVEDDTDKPVTHAREDALSIAETRKEEITYIVTTETGLLAARGSMKPLTWEKMRTSEN